MELPTTEEVRRGHEIARALVTVRIDAKQGDHSEEALNELRHWIIDAADEIEGDRTLLMATLGAFASLTAVIVDILGQLDRADPAQVFQAIAAHAVASDFTW